MTLSFNSTSSKLNFNNYQLDNNSENKQLQNVQHPLKYAKASSLNLLSNYNRPFLSFKESFSLIDFEKTITDKSYYRFTPDRYQKDAAKSIFIGNNLIVTAPTGTGKTLIAEYAIRNALNKNNGHTKRVFYTSPLKALSNYHYNHFKSLYGENNVGIITGERKQNVNAPIVVMTTEVYRNMVYNNEQNSQLKDLDSIIFDECHYMNDPDRGSVWEESMLLTPDHVKKIMLSATIGNYVQIQNWLNSIETPSIDPVKQKNTDLVSVSPSERHVPLEYFILHQLPPTNDADKRSRPFLLSKLTKENLNFDNLKSDLLKNNLTEVQKTELKKFYNTITENKDYISNKLTQTNKQIEMFEMFLQDKNSADYLSSIDFNYYSNFLKEKEEKLTNLLNSVKNLSAIDKNLIASKLQDNKIIKLYDLISMQDTSEGSKQLKDVINSFNVLVKKHRNYDSYGHSLFSSIKNGEYTSLIQTIEKDINLNKDGIGFFASVINEATTNPALSGKTVADLTHDKLVLEIKSKKSLSFMLNGISVDIFNILDENIKRENSIQHCLNIVNLKDLKNKEDTEKLVSILKREKKDLNQILQSVKELFNNPEELKLLLERINITSLTDVEQLSTSETDPKAAYLLKDIIEKYIRLNKINVNNEELGKKILSGIISQTPNELVNYLESKIQEQTSSIEYANSIFSKVTKTTNIPTVIQFDLRKIEREKKSLGVTDSKSLEEAKELKNERKILQKSLITLAKIAYPNNDDINIGDIDSISSIKKSDAAKLKDNLQKLLPIKEEEANRLSLVMSAKEQKEIANASPLQRNGNIPPSKVIKFLKTYKEGSLLPLIYFIFSKAECNAAVEHLLKQKEDLLNEEEKRNVESEINNFLHNNKYFSELLVNESLSPTTPKTFTTFIECLKHGYSVHHKGLLPPQKELVEKLFSQKLLKAVFATETIAAGLDFPAKTVVIDSLEQPYKNYEIISANKFHQIAGRAGRRGKDSVGNVIVINKVNNTKGLTFNLINSPPDSVNSNFKLTYGLTLEMLKNNPFANPREFFQKTFAVFQSDKPQSKRDFSQKNDVLFDIEDTTTLVNESQTIFKKRDRSGKVDLYLKNKREKCINQLEKSPYCIKRYEVDSPEKINTQFNKQKQILNHLLGALSQYDFLFQKNFNDESFNAKEKEKLNKQKDMLIDQLNQGIELLQQTHQKLHLTREEKKQLKDDIGDEFEQKLIENREYLRKLRDFPLTLPFGRDEYITYQINLLNHIKTQLSLQTNRSDKKSGIETVQKPDTEEMTKLTSLIKEFEKRVGILSFPSENDEKAESLLLPHNNTIKLSEKGLIASKIHGINEILASELIYGDKAFLKDLNPREIAAVVSSLVTNIDPTLVENISSHNISPYDILSENVTSAINKIKTRAKELEKMQVHVGLKGNGSKVPVVDNLVNAVYDLTNVHNRFEKVFHYSVGKKPFNYFEGDFAELIFRTIDFLKQLRNSLPPENIDMKLKLQSAINLLIKPPLSSSFIEPKDDKTFTFVSTLYGTASHRVNSKNISKHDIDLMVDHIRAGVDENVKNHLYSYINTSVASLKDFDETLRIIFDKKTTSRILNKISKRTNIIKLFKDEHKSPEEIAQKLNIQINKVQDVIKNYDFDNENNNFNNVDKKILKTLLFDGGYIFEVIAAKKLEKEFLIRAKDFYENKTHQKIDEAYVKDNFRVITNMQLRKNDTSNTIAGEIDFLVFDKNTKKVLLVSEFKVNNNDVGEGYKKRQLNIEQYNNGEIFPNHTVNVDNEIIRFDENSFKWNPETYAVSPIGDKTITAKPENTILLPFDKIDISLMSAILTFELQKELNKV